MKPFATVGRVLFGADQAVKAFVAENLGQASFAAADRGLGILDRNTGELFGGVVYSEFRGHDCRVSIAAKTPAAWGKNTLRTLFEYPFGQLGCRRITCVVSVANPRSARFCSGLGFLLEGRLRAGMDDGSDALIFGLLKHECRWIDG